MSDDREASLRAELAEMTPVDDRERWSIKQFMAELDRLDRPFDEDADTTHVTASAIVCSTAGVLLHLHRRLDLWAQPGGHLDADEHPADAARREALEETGLTTRHTSDPARIVHVDVHQGGRGHTHLDVRYLLWAEPDEPDPPAGESQQVAWFDLSSAIDIADPGLRGFLLSLRGNGWLST